MTAFWLVCAFIAGMISAVELIFWFVKRDEK